MQWLKVLGRSLLFHLSVQACGQLCSMKSAGEASKQRVSVSLDSAFQGRVALPFQTEGKKEWNFIAKGFIWSKGHGSYLSFLLQFQWENSATWSYKHDRGTCHFSPGTILMSRKKGGWTGVRNRYWKERAGLKLFSKSSFFSISILLI